MRSCIYVVEAYRFDLTKTEWKWWLPKFVYIE